jgi:hypothetical protein
MCTESERQKQREKGTDLFHDGLPLFNRQLSTILGRVQPDDINTQLQIAH